MDSNATRKSPQSTERPSYSPRTVGGRSARDACMDGPPIAGGRRRDAAARGCQEQQAGEADRARPEPRGQEAHPSAEGPDDEASERERSELGAVAGAVVRG